MRPSSPRQYRIGILLSVNSFSILTSLFEETVFLSTIFTFSYLKYILNFVKGKERLLHNESVEVMSLHTQVTGGSHGSLKCAPGRTAAAMENE